MVTTYIGQEKSNMKLQSDVKFTQKQLDEIFTVGQGLLALPVSSQDEAHYITGTHEIKPNYLFHRVTLWPRLQDLNLS